MNNNDKDSRNSWRNNINIDPVNIDVSLKAQAGFEYNRLKSIVAVVRKEHRVSKDRMKQINAKAGDITEIAQKAINEYQYNNNKKEELKDILIIEKEAKKIARNIEYKFILDTGFPDEGERRRLMAGWIREQAKKEGRTVDSIIDIDVPVTGRNHIIEEER